MRKKKLEWEQYLDKAKKAHSDEESFLGLAVKSLAREKGFGDYSENFNCCFASESETIITFMEEFEYREMSIETFIPLSKNEICKDLLEYSSHYYAEISSEVIDILTKLCEEN